MAVSLFTAPLVPLRTAVEITESAALTVCRRTCLTWWRASVHLDSVPVFTDSQPTLKLKILTYCKHEYKPGSNYHTQYT